MKSQRGFTLIELLVVMAVFSTLLLVITDIFVNVSTSQRRTLAWQKAQSEMRFSMEFIAQQIRTGRIAYDYATYSDGVQFPEADLAYWESTGRPRIIRKSTSGCDGGVAGCIEFVGPAFSKPELPDGSGDVPDNWSVGSRESLLTGNAVAITRLDFYISPQENPYEFNPVTRDYLSNKQPRVTIIMEGYSVGNTDADKKNIRLQTTVTSRYYER